jgi:hypothetical protein
MADRVMFISWGSPVHGREQRSLEVFNEAMGMLGSMQQDGRIESFDVALLTPGTGLDGFIALHGSSQQLAAVREDQEFQRNMIAADLIVQNLRIADGYTGEGVARQMALYQEAVAQVPQAG